VYEGSSMCAGKGTEGMRKMKSVLRGYGEESAKGQRALRALAGCLTLTS
jgi:hypothetical protein